jgi:hypothetical protein
MAWRPDIHEGPEDGWPVEIAGLPSRADFEVAAEHYFRNRDGWESSWPIEFAITGHGREWRCTVDIRREPDFYAVTAPEAR